MVGWLMCVLLLSGVAIFGLRKRVGRFDSAKAAVTPVRSNLDTREQDFFASINVQPFAFLRIAYSDISGSSSLREIAVYHVDLRNGRMQAFCRYRHERRTFYAKRIKEVVNLENDEIISDLRQFLKAARSNG